MYLGGLSLACASRASWCTSKLQMECSSQCEVDPVSEGGDDQSACVAQVFIAVLKLRVDRTHLQVIVPVVTVLHSV